MPQRLEVIRDWTASYSDPIAVNAGERLVPSGRRDLWEGHPWLWATDPRGRSGWVPDDLIVMRNAEAVAARAFSALELTCHAGEVLCGEEATHGWVLCRAGDDRRGWVPRSHLRDIA